MTTDATSSTDRSRRVQRITTILSSTYPKATIALTYSSPWELLVAVILSAQCTDVRVNMVTPDLFRAYPTIEHFANASLPELEQAIKSTGFYRNKAKNIQNAARMILERFEGKVPDTMEALLTLPGVARKTANVVLGNAYGVTDGIAVDTHVRRLSQRLGLVRPSHIGGKNHATFERNGKHHPDYTKDASPDKIEQELMAVVPKSEWFSLTYRIIDHGRAVCDAKRPRCGECVLSSLCPASRV